MNFNRLTTVKHDDVPREEVASVMSDVGCRMSDVGGQPRLAGRSDLRYDFGVAHAAPPPWHISPRACVGSSPLSEVIPPLVRSRPPTSAPGGSSARPVTVLQTRLLPPSGCAHCLGLLRPNPHNPCVYCLLQILLHIPQPNLREAFDYGNKCDQW